MQKTLQLLEQKGPETSSVSISRLKETAFEHLGEKVLSQILCVGNGAALAADESEDWSPVNFAKLGKCSLRLRVISSRVCAGQNDAPACRLELSIAVAVAVGGVRFHGRRSSHLFGCYASLMIKPLPSAWSVGPRPEFFHLRRQRLR